MKRMNRLSRRVAGAAIGLMLGWWLAGMWGELNTAMPTLAAEEGHTQPHDAADAHAHGSTAHDTDHGDGHAHEAYADPNYVPGEGQTDWYPPVLWAAGGLFIAAIIIGVPMSKLRAPEPATTPASHDAHTSHH